MNMTAAGTGGMRCAHCGRPMAASVWLGSLPYHPECTRGPVLAGPAAYGPTPLTDEDVRRIVIEELVRAGVLVQRDHHSRCREGQRRHGPRDQSAGHQRRDAGQPWFNANDVCASLELANSRDALAKHVDSDDVAKRDIIDSLTPSSICLPLWHLLQSPPRNC